MLCTFRYHSSREAEYKLISRLYKIKEGNTLNRKRKIPQRWGEYVGELFRNEKMIPEIHRKFEIRSSLDKIGSCRKPCSPTF